MDSQGQRKRLKKLKKTKEEHKPNPSNNLVPKKPGAKPASLNFSAPKNQHPSQISDSDSMEDFITDKVEYEAGAGPNFSSEESAHSTDEEGLRPRKRPAKPVSDDEESAKETSEEESQQPQEQEKPKKRLIGKEALEEKRKKGLIPSRNQSKTKKSRKESKPKEKPQKALKPKKQEPKKYIQYAEFETPEERKKAEIVTEILCRWWYVLEDWPPADFDYKPLLEQNKLRVVTRENWSIEPLTDQSGFEKVLEVPGYPGLFMNYLGKVTDLRPPEGCPSFNNLFKKSTGDLTKLLVDALDKQIQALKAQEDHDSELATHLSKKMEYFSKKLKS